MSDLLSELKRVLNDEEALNDFLEKLDEDKRETFIAMLTDLPPAIYHFENEERIHGSIEGFDSTSSD